MFGSNINSEGLQEFNDVIKTDMRVTIIIQIRCEGIAQPHLFKAGLARCFVLDTFLVRTIWPTHLNIMFFEYSEEIEVSELIILGLLEVFQELCLLLGRGQFMAQLMGNLSESHFRENLRVCDFQWRFATFYPDFIVTYDAFDNVHGGFNAPKAEIDELCFLFPIVLIIFL